MYKKIVSKYHFTY